MMTTIHEAFRSLGPTCTPAALASRMGLSRDEVLDELAIWEAASLLCTSDSDGGLAVSLTEFGREEVGLRPGRGQLARVLDEWAGRLRFDPAGYPMPTSLCEGVLWSNHKREVCPTCQGRPLMPSEYCLECDRWGLDDVAASF